MSSKFYIPGWLLADKSITPAAKLILSVLSTRSSETSGGRLSLGISSGMLADLAGLHYSSVERLLKSLISSGMLKKVEGGYLLLDQVHEEEVGTGGDPATPVSEDACTDPPVDLFVGCWSAEDCAQKIRDRGGVRLRDLRYSYENIPDTAPYRVGIYNLLSRLEDRVAKDGLSDTHEIALSV